jgi:hypothetical protein
MQIPPWGVNKGCHFSRGRAIDSHSIQSDENGEQMAAIKREIVIPKEQAVFWMDSRGRWCNAHGPFGHPKIIAYFHHAIRRDRDGYYVEQNMGEFIEKVYFSYVDTPLFAVDIIDGDPCYLITNREDRLELIPEALFVSGDNLYLRHGEESVKFGDQVLIRMCNRIEFREGKYFLFRNGRACPIPEEKV